GGGLALQTVGSMTSKHHRSNRGQLSSVDLVAIQPHRAVLRASTDSSPARAVGRPADGHARMNRWSRSSPGVQYWLVARWMLPVLLAFALAVGCGGHGQRGATTKPAGSVPVSEGAGGLVS